MWMLKKRANKKTMVSSEADLEETYGALSKYSIQIFFQIQNNSK